MVNDDWVLRKVLEFNRKTKPATPDTQGVVKVGSGLYIDSEGRMSVTPFYGFNIDMTISDPAACITYTGLAANLTQAERKAWAYGLVKPTVVKDGEIAYSLSKDNLELKADGVTASDLTGTDGDVCASFSPLWIKISKSGKVISVNLSQYPQPGYISPHTFEGKNKSYVHVGMFECSGATCDSVYSTSATPTVSKSLKQFRTAIQAKNTGLDAAVYSPETYLTNTLIQALLIFAYGTLDSQSAVGLGNVNTSAAIAVGKADLLTCGGEYGDKNTGNTHCMALFIVNPWGNVWKFMDGCMYNGTNKQFAVAADQKDLYDIEGGWETKPATWKVINVPGLVNNWAYITEFEGSNYGGFFPAASGGTGASSSTYACDQVGFSTGDRVCIVGGHWNSAARAGAFELHVSNAPSSADAYLGARLQVLNID